jgi:hypothetical protein
MASPPTHQMLRELLSALGFETGALTENNHRVFRHPGSGCIAVLPDNRDDQPARPADVLGLRDHLACTGHLEDTEFDRYLREGKLSAA